jgi:hypothetical protein
MLRIVADKLDEIPEGLRENAKQVEGQGFVVQSLKEGWGIEDFSGLRKMLTDERQGRKAAERSLAAFDGLLPDEASAARDALDQFKAGKLRGAKELDEWKTSYEAKVKDERSKLESKLAKRTEALRERMLRGELAPVIAAKGGAEAMDAILTLAQQHVRFEETADGDIKTSLVGKDGKPMLTSKTSSGEEAGFDELIEQMRAAPATRGLFRTSATGGSGGSSQTGGPGRAANSDVAFSAMTPEELIQRGLSKSSTA